MHLFDIFIAGDIFLFCDSLRVFIHADLSSEHSVVIGPQNYLTIDLVIQRLTALTLNTTSSS